MGLKATGFCSDELESDSKNRVRLKSSLNKMKKIKICVHSREIEAYIALKGFFLEVANIVRLLGLPKKTKQTGC